MRKNGILCFLSTLLLMSFLAGCQVVATSTATPSALPPPTLPPIPSATASPTLTPTKMITPTPTPTVTVTITPTLTATWTPTTTATPAIAYNQPGTYTIGRCFKKYSARENGYIFCVLNVVVREDKKMQWNVSWQWNLPDYPSILKVAFTSNKEFYVVDDLGNRYDHFEVGGCGAEKLRMKDDETCTGYYMFPLPRPNARIFTFVDTNNQLLHTIPNVVLRSMP